jgi:hypothetical protein
MERQVMASVRRLPAVTRYKYDNLSGRSFRKTPRIASGFVNLLKAMGVSLP